MTWLRYSLSALTLSFPPFAFADKPQAPATLPGKGLAQHDFFYAGESKDRKMVIVKKGEIVWSYDDPAGNGEISDAILLSNGNVLLAHQFAVKLVTPDKQVLWNFDAPAGCEIHTAQMIGKEHVLFVQCGNPALVKVVNIVSGETRQQFELPVGNPKSVHGQLRHARLTAAGTLLVAHMDADKVSEYDASGKEIRTLPSAGPWGVTPLRGGHILITERTGVREVDRAGQTVWSFAKADAPDYQLTNLQLAWRLPNGNTVLNNWFNQWSDTLDKANAPVQAIEVTPEKQVVWALRSWETPDLGPSTTFQFLDDPAVLDAVTFGDIK
jgi:hypothetical protein